MTRCDRTKECGTPLSPKCRRGVSQRGYTLVELVVSMGVMSVLMMGMGSVILIASKALPDGQSPLEITIQSSAIADQIAGELRYAMSVTETTPTALEFAVPDRNHGAAGAETIRYEWSGTLGDPLTRQYNGGTVVSVVEDVQAFDLTYNVKVVQAGFAPSALEGAETLLTSYETDDSNFAITADAWGGQYFLPSLPPEAISWKVTRVQLLAQKSGGTSGLTMVQLRPADTGNVPASTVLEEILFPESLLGNSPSWQEFTFTNVSGLSPSEGLCLVVTPAPENTNVDPCILRYNSAGGSGILTTYDGGLSWTNDAGQAMAYYVYGTITTGDGPLEPVAESFFLIGVEIGLRVGPDASTRVETAVQVLNAPEVAGP